VLRLAIEAVVRSLKKRILFGVAGALILFPSKMWVDGMGFTLFMAGWLPTLILRRQVPVQSKMG